MIRYCCRYPWDSSGKDNDRNNQILGYLNIPKRENRYQFNKKMERKEEK